MHVKNNSEERRAKSIFFCSMLLALCSLLLATSPSFATLIVNQNFEGVGTDNSETWYTYGTSAGTMDFDYPLTEDVSGDLMPGSGTECFRAVTSGAQNARKAFDAGSQSATTFLSPDINVVSESGMVSTDAIVIWFTNDAVSGNNVFKLRVYKESNGTRSLQFQYYSSGALATDANRYVITLGKVYRVKVKYDASNHTNGWGWWVYDKTGTEPLFSSVGDLANVHRAGIREHILGITGVAGKDLEVRYDHYRASATESEVDDFTDSSFGVTDPLYPSSDVTTEWFIASGSHYAALEDDSDTTYVYMDGSEFYGKQELFGMDDPTVYPGRIINMQYCVRAKRYSNSREMRITGQNNRFLLSDDWETYCWDRPQNENTSRPWTWADIENLQLKFSTGDSWASGAEQWTAITAYSYGDVVYPATPNGFYYRCIIDGTSGAGTPSWSTTLDGDTTDGSVTWRTIPLGVTANWWGWGGAVSKIYIKVQYGSSVKHRAGMHPVCSGITSNSFKILGKALIPPYSDTSSVSSYLKIRYATDSSYLASCTGDCVETSSSGAVNSPDDWTYIFNIPSLSANTKYYYDVYASGDNSTFRSLHDDMGWEIYPSCKTAPSVGAAFTFLLEDDHHQRGGSNVYKAGSDKNGFVSICLGDCTKPITDASSVGDFQEAFRTGPYGGLSTLWKYVTGNMGYEGEWDGHDYGMDEGDKCFAYKDNSLAAFLDYRPLPDPPAANPNYSRGVWHSTRLGDIELFFTDFYFHGDPRYINGGDRLDGLRTKDTSACGGNPTPGDASFKDTGTTTSTLSNHLVEAGQNFSSTVSPGDVVMNTTDTTYALVTNVTDTDLTLSADIMTNNETYNIYESGASHGPNSGNHYQRDWLINGINNSEARWVAWASSTIFNPTVNDSNTNWGNYDPLEAQLNYIIENITNPNFFIISGNNHYAGIDDGTNSYFPELVASPSGGYDNHPPNGTWSECNVGMGDKSWKNYYGRFYVTESYVDLEARDEADNIVCSLRLNYEGGIYGVEIADLMAVNDALSISKLYELIDTIAAADNVSRMKFLEMLDNIAMDDSDTVNKLLQLFEAVTVAEQTSLDKSLLAIDDGVSMIDYAFGDKTLTIPEAIGINDGILRNKTFLLDDTMPVSDEIALSKLIQIQEALAYVDSILTNKLIAISDSTGIADSILRDKQTVITDALAAIDNILANKTFTLSDLLDIAEGVNVAKYIFKYVNDSISLADVALTNKNLNVLDFSALSDSTLANKALKIEDSMGLIDALLRDKILSLTDLTGINDYAYRDKAFAIIETVGMIENLLANKTLTVDDLIAVFDSIEKLGEIIKEVLDSMSVTDGILTNKNITIPDIIALAESVLTHKILNVNDQQALSDAMATLKTFVISDQVAVTEEVNVAIATIKEILDSIPLIDAVQTHKILNILDTAAINDIAQTIAKDLIITERIPMTDFVLALKTLIMTDQLSMTDAAELLGQVIKILNVTIEMKSPTTTINLKSPSVSTINLKSPSMTIEMK